MVDLPGFGPGTAQQLVEHLVGQVRDLAIPIQYESEVAAWDGRRLYVSSSDVPVDADWLFYAPGLKARTLHAPGEQWISQASVSALAGERPGLQLLIAGAGDRAVEGAIRLVEAGHQVTLASRSPRIRARGSYRQRLIESGAAILFETTIARIEPHPKGKVGAWLRSPHGDILWTGDQILARIGMEPRVHPELASVRGDIAYPRVLGMSIIGDAALPAWERSLVSAFASSMRAVKESSKRMDGR